MTDLKVPTQIDLMWPTLQALVKRGGSASVQQISKEIAEILELPSEILRKRHRDGSQSELDYRAGWARTRLKHLEAVINNGRGIWSITDYGRSFRSEQQVIEKDRKEEAARAIAGPHKGQNSGESNNRGTSNKVDATPSPVRLERQIGGQGNQSMPTSENPLQPGDEVREEYFDNLATGVEVETQDPLLPEEPEPWDPDKIRVHTKHYSLRQVVDMMVEGDIDLAPDFQRQYVWKPPQRWGLIESLLLGIPLPSFYFNEDPSGQLQVVDGVQRLTTILRYVTDHTFKLGKVTYLYELEGYGFKDLTTLFRRRLNSTQFVVHVIDPQTPYRVKFEIFRRINTGGSPLSAQEIRHCMSRTPSREFLKDLVNDQSFITATGGALHNHPRMADREVALRFVAFRLFTSSEYAQYDSFDEFLGSVTRRLDDSSRTSLDQIRTDFVRGMTNCYRVFGEHAFRKWPLGATRKTPINRALFESWGTVLADYDETVIRKVAIDLVKRAREMMTTDFDFINSISGSTGDLRNVRTRLGKVRAAAVEVLR